MQIKLKNVEFKKGFPVGGAVEALVKIFWTLQQFMLLYQLSRIFLYTLILLIPLI